MNHIISIVLFALLGAFFLVDYFKDKKTYRLLVMIPLLIAIFFQTPISNSISKVVLNLLVAISILVGIFICYLVIQDEKNKNSNIRLCFN